jgi:hypothetical protein
VTLAFPLYPNDVALKKIKILNRSQNYIELECENLNWNISMYCLIPMLTIKNLMFPNYNKFLLL